MTEIASGEITIDVRDKDAIAALHRINSEFDRSMDKIEREKASATVGLETAGFDQAVKNTQRKLKSLNGEKVDLEVDSEEFNRVNAQIELTEKKIKRLDGQKADFYLKVHGDDEVRKAERQVDKLREKSERLARTTEVARTRAEQAAKRELAMIPKLRSEYVKLMRQVEQYDARRRKAGKGGDKRAVLQVDIDQEGLLARYEAVRRELEARGAIDPLDIELNISPGRNFGQSVRAAFDKGGTAAVARQAGSMAGDSFTAGLRSKTSKLNKVDILAGLGGGLARGASRVGGLLTGLASATVRIGPFTASLKGALVGMTALAPIITSVGGSLVALGGAFGSAALGLGALSAGFIGGLIPAAIGVFAVLKPVTKQFGNAMKATEAYNQAVSKNGKNSEQAKKKLVELDNVLGNVDRATRKNYINAGKMRDSWADATKPARATAFRIMGQGIDYLSKNVGMFGKNTSETFGAAEKSTSRWFKGLNSPEGKRILDTMWDNFNSSLGPAMDGLGNLATVFGRVGRIASSMMPQFAQQFKNWSQGLADSSGNANTMRQKIEGWVDSLRSVGRFLRSTGQLLSTVFGGGVKSGVGLLDDMANAMNRWNTSLESSGGQEKLATFFDRARSGAQSLFGLLAPIISSFVQWADAMTPVVSGFLKGAGAVGSLVAKVLSLTALQGPITALAATMGALWAVGKIGAWVSMIGNATKALVGMKAAATGAAAANAVAAGSGAAGVGRGAAAAGIGRTAAMGAGATAATAKVGILRQAATKLIPSIAAMGAVAGGAATAGLGVLAAAAIYGGYKLATMDSDVETATKSLAKMQEAAKGAAANYRTGTVAGADLGSAAGRSALNIKQLRDVLAGTKKGTDAYRLAQFDLNDAIRAGDQVQKAYTAQRKKNYQEAKTQLVAERDIATQQEKVNKLKRAAENKPGALAAPAVKRRYEETIAQLDEEEAKLGDLTAAADRAENRIAAWAVTGKREAKGMLPILGQAEQQLGRLARAGQGKLAQKIAVKFEKPKDVGRVAAAAGRTLKAGVPKSITSKIVTDSRSAEGAVKRLQRVRIKAVKFEIIQQGGPKAIAMLERIKGSKLTKKQLEVVQRGGPKVLELMAKLRGYKLTKAEKEIGERGGRATLSQLSKIAGYRVGQALKNITDGGSGSRVLGILGQLAGNKDLGTDTKTILTVHKSVGGSRGQGAIYRAAGESTRPADAARAKGSIARTNERVARGQVAGMSSEAFKRGGKKISKPTLVMGEEASSEYVIATNPKYRKANVAALKNAAQALGVSIDEDNMLNAGTGLNAGASGKRRGGGNRGGGGGGRRGGGGGNAYGYNAPNGRYDGYETTDAGQPNAPEPPGSAFRKAGRNSSPANKNGAYVNQNDWARYIEDVKIKKSDWERELSVRQSVLDPPDDFIRKTGKTLTNGDPEFEIDQPAINGYTARLKDVHWAHDKVMDWDRILATEIPKARIAIRREIDQRQALISKLKEEIKKHLRRVAALRKENRALGTAITNIRKGPGKPKDKEKKIEAKEKKIGSNNDKIGTQQTKISTKQGQISDHESEISTLQGDDKTLIEDAKDAGFDYREQAFAKRKVADEINRMGGDAAEQLAGTTGEGTGGGGGSGGSDSGQLSYGQEIAAAAIEKKSVLTEYAGNVNGQQGGAPPTGSGGSGPAAKSSVAEGPGQKKAASPQGSATPSSGGSTGTGGSSSGSSSRSFGPGGTTPSSGGTGSTGSSRSGSFDDSGSPSNGSAVGSLGSAMGGAAAAARAGSGAGVAIAGGRAAGVMGSRDEYGTDGGATQVEINNTFATVPPDPHIWSKGVEFEIGSVL